jgi:hypothetical protein
MLARSLWRFHEPVSFGHFRAWFGRTQGAAAAHPLLAAFLQHEADLPLVKHIADMLPWLRIVQHAYGDGVGTARLKRASCRLEGGALTAKEGGEELVTMAHAVEAYAATGGGGNGKAGDNEGEAGERRREAEAALAAFCRAFNAVLPKIDTIRECNANPFIAGSHPGAIDGSSGRLKEGAATHVDLRSYLSAAERVEDRANAVGLTRAAPIAFALPNNSTYDGDVYDAEMCCVDQVRWFTVLLRAASRTRRRRPSACWLAPPFAPSLALTLAFALPSFPPPPAAATTDHEPPCQHRAQQRRGRGGGGHWRRQRGGRRRRGWRGRGGGGQRGGGGHGARPDHLADAPLAAAAAAARLRPAARPAAAAGRLVAAVAALPRGRRAGLRPARHRGGAWALTAGRARADHGGDAQVHRECRSCCATLCEHCCSC